MKIKFKKQQINYSDLLVLAKLIAIEKSEVFVFDPDGKVNWDVEQNLHDINYEKRILFNFGGELIQYKSYALNEFDHIIDFSKKINVDQFNQTSLQLIKDPAGRVRYLFPENQKSVAFLAFLPQATLRSKVIKWGIKAICKLGQARLLGSAFNLLSSSEPRFLTTLNTVSFTEYAIFMGTPGHWQKPVIQVVNNGVVNHYIKFAINRQTYELIEQEKTNLKRIGSLELKQLKVPEVVNDHGATIVQQALIHEEAKQQHQFTDLHFYGLKGLMMKSMKMEQIEDTPFFDGIVEQMHYLTCERNNPFEKLTFLLAELRKTIPAKNYMKTTIAHGDFTPWNVKLTNDQVLAYDWEMSMFGAPALYDIFHFIYQSQIIVNRKGIKEVEHELEWILKQPPVAEFIERFKINVVLNHQLYLLHAISKNLVLFCKQGTLSVEHKLLLKSWEEALLKMPIQLPEVDARREFLADLQSYLNDKNYVALKFFLNDFTHLPLKSDLDLAIDENMLEDVITYMEKHRYVAKCVRVKKSFMSVIKLYLVNDAFLSVDLIHDFIRKGKQYLNIKDVLEMAKVETGVRRPFILHDIEYAQHFYTLNYSAIPERYQTIFTRELDKKGITKAYLLTAITKYGIEFKNVAETFSYSSKKLKGIKEYIRLKSSNHPVIVFNRALSYLQDVWVDIVDNKGFMVTFSGVDGAGKTTIINAVKERFEEKYRKEVVLLRHRPGILPILSAAKYGGRKKAEEKAGERLPRQGKNKSTFSSLLRFGYYFADYLLGQGYVYVKYILRGKIVIYDRYYFDFINDAKRSNIALQPSFIKSLYPLIYKADFNFYLYNEPEIILQRKQELKAEDILTLNQRYSQLFNELNASGSVTYRQVKNDRKADTVAHIFETINAVAS